MKHGNMTTAEQLCSVPSVPPLRHVREVASTIVAGSGFVTTDLNPR